LHEGLWKYFSPKSPKPLNLARTVAIVFSFLSVQLAIGQVVFEPSQNLVYGFLEEMAAEGHIRINTFARPFARTLIAAQLDSLSAKRDKLNDRQKYQLDFFLKDYGKELQVGRDWDRRRDMLYRSDSVFDITVNPIFGGSVMANNNGSRVHRRIGGEFFANAGRVGMYGSIRDNNVTEVLAAPQYMTPLDGQNYKNISADNRSDYNEAMGGISYQWRWGDVSVVKDRLVWGNTVNHSNIFSGKAPSYAQVYFRMYPLPWLDFQYMHGWLVSDVLDSARTYLTPNGNRRVQTNKNIAANFFTIKSNWDVDFTFGNSIVYSDDGFQLAYWIPFMFFKSVDHTYSGTGSNELGQNSQMYMDISIRTLRKVHFYTSVFIDELSIGNMFDPANHTNVFSVKVGGTWFNALPNLHLSAEYTRTNPWTYRHQIPSTTFASNGYNIGHYLGENADELFCSATYRPWRNLVFKGSFWSARKGPEHVYEIIAGNANVTGLKFMEYVDWNQYGLRLDTQWEIINGGVIFMAASYQSSSGNPIYTPEFLAGDIFTAEAGFRIGL
jgi:hypothetical protein